MTSPSHLAQGSIHDFGHERFAHFLSHAVSESPIDIRHFKSLNTIVSDVGHKVDIVDIKFALQLSLGINLSEKVDFVFVEIFSHLLTLPKAPYTTLATSGLLISSVMPCPSRP